MHVDAFFPIFTGKNNQIVRKIIAPMPKSTAMIFCFVIFSFRKTTLKRNVPRKLIWAIGFTTDAFPHAFIRAMKKMMPETNTPDVMPISQSCFDGIEIRCSRISEYSTPPNSQHKAFNAVTPLTSA